MSSERQYRMSDIVPAERLADLDIAVVGVGAIGRNVALQLAQIGAESLTLIDPDTVEELNVGPQGFYPSQIGYPKATVTARAAELLNPDAKMVVIEDIYKPGMLDSQTVIFACVDSMGARRQIFENERRHLRFFCDGRMAAEVCRILTVDDTDSLADHYITTLHTDDQAVGEPCTAKSTCYCANIAAGLMLGQFTKWLRGIPLMQPEIICNILSAEMSVVESKF